MLSGYRRLWKIRILRLWHYGSIVLAELAALHYLHKQYTSMTRKPNYLNLRRIHAIGDLEEAEEYSQLRHGPRQASRSLYGRFAQECTQPQLREMNPKQALTLI